ncbi:MAG TPA: hypothetical protein VGF14_07900 [Alphaproteobacteria bacterium]
MTPWIAPFILSFSNCYFRGGGLSELIGPYTWGRPAHWIVTFILSFLFITTNHGMLTHVGVPVEFIPYVGALLVTIGMIIGETPGWGAYVGTINGSTKPHPQVKWIDKIIQPLIKWPFWWAFAGLTLRGLFWGVCLAAGSLNIWFIPLSALMGVFYAIGMNSKVAMPPLLDPWKLSEIMYGFILGLGFVFQCALV